MLSSGPGSPNKLDDILVNIEGLLNKFPVFAQDLGQELIAKSFGANINKMKLGHRGANQPVKDLVTGNVLITAQNHGFSIDKDSLEGSDLELTQVNLNDGTPEGFKHKELPLSIGGGIGIPPLYLLAKELIKKGIEVTIIMAFNTKKER